MSDKFILDVEEAAAHLRCQPSTIRESARTGRIPGIKFGDDWVFPLESLVQSLNAEALQLQAVKRILPPSTPVMAAPAPGRRVDARRRPMPNLDAFTPVGGNA